MKKDLRTAILSRRLALPPAEVAARSARIQERVWALPALQGARVIVAYAACRNEVQTEKLINEALLAGKRVALPVTDINRQEIFMRAVGRYPEDLVPGVFGIPEPREACPAIAPEEIDLVLVPGVAYDINGYRLGYGRGYYDRFLPRLRPGALTVGLAYAFQIVPTVYPEAHDRPVRLIVTEEGIIQPLKKGSGAHGLQMHGADS